MIIDQKNREIISRLFGNKSKCWAYEEEMRIVTGLPGKHGYNKKYLKSVIFGFKMSQEHKDKMISNLSHTGISFYQVNRQDNSYTLFLEKIEA
jgi:hypothetical protein